MAMKNFLLGLSKFVLGIILAMLIVSLASLSMARYFMTRLIEPPERPTYDNDLPEQQPAADAPTPDGDSSAAPDSNASSSETAEETETESETEPTSGGEIATVDQPVGLVLRSGPGVDYDQIGGVAYEESVEVIAEENGWLNIVLSGGQEGWVKGGNNVSYE
ncbi:MAG: SH3 domain-containing protein [Phormidesmis sp.]